MLKNIWQELELITELPNPSTFSWSFREDLSRSPLNPVYFQLDNHNGESYELDGNISWLRTLGIFGELNELENYQRVTSSSVNSVTVDNSNNIYAVASTTSDLSSTLINQGDGSKNDIVYANSTQKASQFH